MPQYMAAIKVPQGCHSSYRLLSGGCSAAAPDKDALKGEAARVALLRDRVHVALAVAAGRVLEARARGGQLGQLQQVRCCGLDSAQEGVQPAEESQSHE